MCVCINTSNEGGVRTTIDIDDDLSAAARRLPRRARRVAGFQGTLATFDVALDAVPGAGAKNLPLIGAKT
jgi:hypothetical protein